MSDLGRWRDEGASGEEQRLLETARGERPNPALRARTLDALGLSAPAPGGGGSGAGPAPAASGRLLSLVKLAGVVLAVGGAITAGVLATRGQSRPQAGAAEVVLVVPASPAAAARERGASAARGGSTAA